MFLTDPLFFFFFNQQQQPANPANATARYTAIVQPLSYILKMPGDFMPQSRTLPPIDAGVPQTVGADFGRFLPPGVMLTGSPAIAISVVTGTDPTPQDRLTSSPTIGTAPIAQGGTGVTNTTIFQQITPLGDVTYLVWFKCGRSDGSDEVSDWYHQSGDTPS